MGHTVQEVNKKIKGQSAMYLFRSTPFTDHSEFNYDGVLEEDFFFEHLFSEEGRYERYAESIKKVLDNHTYKTVLLIGNQGCGKTTFVHGLKYRCANQQFLYFDFDQDTSNPTLEEYMEKMSDYLQSLINAPDSGPVNKRLHKLYTSNKQLISEKINGDNRIGNFFEKFEKVFLAKSTSSEKENFKNEIAKLFFNQILSLIVLWHIARRSLHDDRQKPIVFCLDNLDVLVNQEIIENFFEEYFMFVRNIDGVVNHLNDDFVRNNGITYNSMFSVVLVCRQHTWARVRQHYPHDNPIAHVSIKDIDVTDAFDKSEILSRRVEYIRQFGDYFGDFLDDVSNARSIMNDLDTVGRNSQTIYSLFNDDYRQCVLTVEDILKADPELLTVYSTIRRRLSKGSQGLRGIIYRALFDKFKKEGVFSAIGVLDVRNEHPYVSNARLLLNYLNYSTYGEDRFIPFSQIVSDFSGIISKDDINNALVAMFALGFRSSWDELIAFEEIDKEEVDSCEGTRIFITSAGHEYINFMATHFEFFSTRVNDRRFGGGKALFCDNNIEPYPKPGKVFEYHGNRYNFTYNFEETIFYVMKIVDRCCENMARFYQTYMQAKYPTKEGYLSSPYVYGDSNVLHGERIIHTHIRYIDNYRLYLLSETSPLDARCKENVNERLVSFIREYIRIGQRNPLVLTSTSSEHLFPEFEKRIKAIEESDYTDFGPIDVDKRQLGPRFDRNRV